MDSNMSQRRTVANPRESFISPLRLRPKAVRQPVATLVAALQAVAGAAADAYPESSTTFDRMWENAFTANVYPPLTKSLF